MLVLAVGLVILAIFFPMGTKSNQPDKPKPYLMSELSFNYMGTWKTLEFKELIQPRLNTYGQWYDVTDSNGVRWSIPFDQCVRKSWLVTPVE